MRLTGAQAAEWRGSLSKVIEQRFDLEHRERRRGLQPSFRRTYKEEEEEEEEQEEQEEEKKEPPNSPLSTLRG
jgi:hypothetical protein